MSMLSLGRAPEAMAAARAARRSRVSVNHWRGAFATTSAKRNKPVLVWRRRVRRVRRPVHASDREVDHLVAEASAKVGRKNQQRGAVGALEAGSGASCDAWAAEEVFALRQAHDARQSLQLEIERAPAEGASCDSSGAVRRHRRRGDAVGLPRSGSR